MNAPTNETSLANQGLSPSVSQLPDSWVTRIFDHMSGLYGSKFADLWNGSNADSVRRMWAAKLSGFRSMPGAIKEALDALDSKPFPPTLPEFLALCRDAAKRLDGPKIAIEYKPTAEEQAKANEAIKKASERMTKTDSRDHRAWAKKLQARHASGEVLATQAMDYARYL